MTTIEATDVHEILKKHQLTDGMDIVLDLEQSTGPWVHDSRSGDKFLDCFTCYASWPLGYNHPGLNEASFEKELLTVAKANPSNCDLYSSHMASFVDAFATHVSPEGFDHHFWIAGGSLAVENCMKAAFDWKARKLGRTSFHDNVNDLTIVHFDHAFHGRSGYTLSVTNTLPDKVGLFPKFNWPRISSPACEFDHDGNICNDVEALERHALAELRAFHESWSRRGNYKHIAAILIEPMQCEGGDRTFRPEFLRALRDFAHEAECLLIFDEVQTGFFGSGKPWYWQHSGATPDLVAFGKKSQVCGMYAGPRLDEVEDNVFHKSSRISSTWGGGLTDMVRSRRFIELIVEHGYCQNAHERGEQIKAGLRRIAKDTNKFTSVRGEGTLLAFDFANGEQRGEMLKKLYDHKVLGLPCGDKTVRLRTPLSMEAGEADEVLNRIEAAAGAVDSGSCCGCC